MIEPSWRASRAHKLTGLRRSSGRSAFVHIETLYKVCQCAFTRFGARSLGGRLSNVPSRSRRGGETLPQRSMRRVFTFDLEVIALFRGS